MSNRKQRRIMALEIEVATLKAQLRALEGLVLGTPRIVSSAPDLYPKTPCEVSQLELIKKNRRKEDGAPMYQTEQGLLYE